MKFIAILTLLTAFNAVASVMVCYFSSWAVYRPSNGKFDVEDIDPSVCTHLVFAFAGLDENTWEIKVLDPYNELCDNFGKCAYDRFVALKDQNPNLKTLLAVGGWNEGSTKYSQMASDATRRATFIQSSLDLILAHKFDGLDLDWEYPTQRGGAPEDKQNYILLLSEFRAAFDQHGLLLTAAVSASKAIIDEGYDVPGVSQNLDLIHLMTYDFHGTFETFTHHVSPLYAYPADTGDTLYFNADFAVQYWISSGADPQKLVMGIPLYGPCWNLDDPGQTGIYAPASQPAPGGPYTNNAGTLGYYEICDGITNQAWTVVHDPDLNEPYTYNVVDPSRRWCSYEDPASSALKAQYAANNNLGGCMAWSIDTDDFIPTCHQRSFELIRTIHETFIGGPLPTIETTSTSQNPTGSTTTTLPIGDCSQSGYYADENDCSIYYECVDNGDGTYTTYTFNCPEGTLFNEAILVCDYTANVCASGQNCPNNCP